MSRAARLLLSPTSHQPSCPTARTDPRQSVNTSWSNLHWEQKLLYNNQMSFDCVVYCVSDSSRDGLFHFPYFFFLSLSKNVKSTELMHSQHCHQVVFHLYVHYTKQNRIKTETEISAGHSSVENWNCVLIHETLQCFWHLQTKINKLWIGLRVILSCHKLGNITWLCLHDPTNFSVMMVDVFDCLTMMISIIIIIVIIIILWRLEVSVSHREKSKSNVS